MRLAIDATPVTGRRKGIGVVLDGLISAAPPDSMLGSAILFVDEGFESEARERWPGRELRPVKMKSSLVWETRELPGIVAAEKIDAVITARDRTVLGNGARSIVWLFEIPDHRVALLRKSRASLYRKLVAIASLSRFRRIARRVTHFVVSSEFTRTDLRERYAIPEERITMISPGISDEYRDATAPVTRPYVLHFATGDLRDNSDLAMRAFARATSDVSEEVILLLAGVPDDLHASIEESAHTLGIEDRIEIRGYVPAAEMPGLFAGARVYFDPTIFEGFGLQLLEAMAAGAPVVTSNESSAAEVVGDAGILAAASDERGFAAAIGSLLKSEALRERYSALGRERASSYTWRASVATFERLLESLQ